MIDILTPTRVDFAVQIRSFFFPSLILSFLSDSLVTKDEHDSFQNQSTPKIALGLSNQYLSMNYCYSD